MLEQAPIPVVDTLNLEAQVRQAIEHGLLDPATTTRIIDMLAKSIKAYTRQQRRLRAEEFAARITEDTLHDPHEPYIDTRLGRGSERDE